MDSITQITLGAAVGVAVMGRRTAIWKAMLWGGVVAALPDLDVLIEHGDPISNMTEHRTQTHAIFWQTLATPPIAAGIAAIHRKTEPFRQNLPRWLLAVWLMLVTHSLLDWMTVYGTQLALPFSDHPFGIGSVFIIDPLFTLPLIAGLIAAARAQGDARYRWNLTGLTVAVLYLGWGVAVQAHVTGLVRDQLALQSEDAAVERLLVTPTAFNSVLWRVLVMRGDRYDEGFHSLLDRGRPIRFDTFDRGAELYRQTGDQWAVERIAWFSRGFFRMRERSNDVLITDLRMGQEPYYIFSFIVAARGNSLQPVTPIAAGSRSGLDFAAYASWLWRRIGGADLPPPRGDAASVGRAAEAGMAAADGPAAARQR